jgi:hypothetical protein
MDQSFDDLKKLPSKELADLSYESCQQICLASLKNTLDDQHIFEFILVHIADKHISYDQLQTTLQLFIPKLNNFVSEMLKTIEAETSPPFKTLEILLSTVNILQECFTYLMKIIAPHSIYEHIDIPLQMLKILQKFLKYQTKKQNNNDELNKLHQQLLTKCTKIENILNFLLAEGEISLNSENSEDFVNVLKLLCEIAETNIVLECFSAEVNIWKTLMKLAKNYLPALQKLHKADDNIWSWLEIAMKVLNNTIHQNLVNCLENTPEKRKKFLKMNEFHLKIMIGIAGALENDYFRGHEHVLPVLIYLQR